MIDMQEDKVVLMNQHEQEQASSKQIYEHQLHEFRKHIQTLESDHSTCKEKARDH